MKKKESIFNKDAMDFLTRYHNQPSPTGFEWKNQQQWMEYLKPYVDKFETNTYGTAIGIINPEAEYKVVLEAHADEISWYVNYITDDGMIYVTANGGIDEQIAPAKRVNIHTEKGTVKGVFGWPATHIREKDVKPEKNNIFIDVGRHSRKEVQELGIEVGNVITYCDDFFVLNDDKFVSRALDNRIGGFMLAQVAMLLKENGVKLPFGVYFTNSVQEESGRNGAEMIAGKIKPDVVIVTDVTHDTTTPLLNEKKDGHAEIGKGPVLPVAPSVHNKLRKKLIDAAKAKKLPFQHLASTSTGTDTDAFAYSNSGVASVLVSLPIRYMHTPAEMVDKNDVENTIRLLYEGLLVIKDGEDFRYIQPIK
ncbi:M20/M25/M40 family metallo-hydrolase [Aequorivita sp. SDUM287046]|uniref:M20/M25/M40 family metallo-hydrolase n=1 Tax=Aequorivita aurantiaca TaxID=3053356 RepID=A0ABT8DJ37_9FLAO|nr:M20/M25/M40 family metallo-hydrolase [Aequorivita aurantiaca]MDN3725402.1 M20/M25/M40 family metallo-hydrolase [Aequorivita aurantiaca]